MWATTFGSEDDFANDPRRDGLMMDSDRVMKEIQRLYLTKDVGLKDAAKSVPDRNFRVAMPRRKITVLIVGSHNAAKQRFLDLYFSDSRPVAGDGFISKVDYDKLDKIYITHGNQRRLLYGETVLDYCPHLAQLKNVPGLKDYLTTEIATRDTKSLVSFILAPESIPVPSRIMPINDSVELTDYDNNNEATRTRSLDMTQALGKLTEAADLIFLFFDPTCTVPAKDTLQPFEPLWETHYEKILLLLARADQDECSEESREEALAQLVTAIWRNPTVKRVGYLPEIYCPDLTSGIRDDERVWNMIQNSADQSVDRALSQLEADATNIKRKLEDMQKENNYAKLCSGDVWKSLLVLVVVAFILFGIWRSHINSLICQLVGEDVSQRCREAVSNKELLICICSMGFALTLYMLADKKPTLLTVEEEEIISRRIQFANHALYRKEAMERFYAGLN